MDDCCGAPTPPYHHLLPIPAQWLFLALLWIFTPQARAVETASQLDIDIGHASIQLNEFSRQADIQILFDFNKLGAFVTNAVHGTYTPSEGLRRMLRGTGLQFDWVNDRTLAVTPKPTLRSRIAKWLSRLKNRSRSHPGDADEVIVATSVEDDPPPPAGARELQFDRSDLERSGVVTVQDFLHTRPELFGGGPAEGTLLGAEQQSNYGFGVGANYRGLGAGSTVALLNGRPMAPSGNIAAFADVSNIPLSAVDHIDMIPEGGTARYGGEAVGGVINFVLRDHFDGAETQAHTGFASGNTLGEQQFDHLWGTNWGDATMLVALEYFRRDSLAASDRALATSDLRPWGGSNFDSPFGNPATLVVGSQTWAIPRSQDGRSLSASDLTAGTQSSHDLNEYSTILPSQRRFNLYTRSTVSLTEDTQLFADALLGSRRFVKYGPGETAMLTLPSANPFYVNPSGDSAEPVQLLYGFGRDLGAERQSGDIKTGNIAMGWSSVPSAGWKTTGEVGFAFEKQRTKVDNLVNFDALDIALADANPLTAFNPVGDGSHTNPTTLATLRSQALFKFDSTYWFAKASADRALVTLPGGDLDLFVGSDLKRERLERSTHITESPLTSETQYRNVVSGFGELRVPVVGSANRMQGIENLELSFAERIEHYSDEGTVSTPSFTAAWSPSKNLRFRATDAWIFKAPNLGDLSEANTGSELAPLTDARSPTGQTIALVTFGGNRDLRPEHGRSWSVGVDFNPQSLPGLTLALTHYEIFVDGRIDSLSLSYDVLDDPRFSAFVDRNPTAEDRSTACHRGTFYGDLASCLTATGPIVNGRQSNISHVRTRGFDLAAKYTLTTSAGDFNLGLDATYVSQFAEAMTEPSPLLDLVNTDHNPLSFRARASIGYKLGRFGATTYVNYASHYRDTDSVPERAIAAWTTIDAQFNYDVLSPSVSALSNLRLTASIQNLLGTNPPFLNNQVGVGWDQENATPFGRQVRVTVRKRW